MRLTAFLILPVVLTLTACDGDGTDTDVANTDTDVAPTAPSETDEELAAALFAEIDGFESWPQIAPWQGIVAQSAGSPHGPFVQIWLNDAASEAAADVQGGGTFPDGSILVKYTYGTDQAGSVDPETYVMKKIEGYGTTDWFWARYTDDQGGFSNVGEPANCIGCHSAGDDYSRVLTDVPG